MSDEIHTSPRNESPVGVSVVIPVYNAMPYLTILLESLVAQDLAPHKFEVIAINDGSTDESPAVLDAYASRHANFTAFHQENAGWPGKPRNVGLDASRGRYVFFADADDQFGVEALRRMVEFADEHGSDLVAPKMVGVNGRLVLDDFYAETLPDVDLEHILQTLSPQKLFRRSMLLDFGIRFPEGKIRLEDGMMLARAYFKARRVSLLCDYDYYFLRNRDDGQNISSRRLDPTEYTWSIGEVSRLIRENDPDPARADRIILDLHVRKCLKMYEPERFARMTDEYRDRWIHEHRQFMAEYITPELEAELPYPFRHRSQLVRDGDKDGLLKLGKFERDQIFATLVGARWSFRSLLLEIEVEARQATDDQGDLALQLQDRGSDSWSVSPLRIRKNQGNPEPTNPAWADIVTTAVGSAKIPRKMLGRKSKTVIDVHLGSNPELTASRARVDVSDGVSLPVKRDSIRPYTTVRGNFSIEVAPRRSQRSRWRRRLSRALAPIRRGES